MMLDAVITAGGDPVKDADLLAYAGGAPNKALIELGGKTFLERIVIAMQKSGRVRRIVIVGLAPEHQRVMGSDIVFLPDTGSMYGNGCSGVNYLQSTGGVSDRILASSSDVPLLTAQVVSEVIDLCLPYDVDFCYNIVEQSVMERAFPGSGRTFVPIEGKRYAGGDLNMVRAAVLDTNQDKINEIIGERKSFWKQVKSIGLDTLFLFLVRRLTIAKIERRVEKVLGFSGKAVICPYAQVAMDVDKPHHLDVVREAFSRHLQEA
jgi:GTP:adenosylcobinamide-phosphate guanylyltransferase